MLKSEEESKSGLGCPMTWQVKHHIAVLQCALFWIPQGKRKRGTQLDTNLVVSGVCVLPRTRMCSARDAEGVGDES